MDKHKDALELAQLMMDTPTGERIYDDDGLQHIQVLTSHKLIAAALKDYAERLECMTNARDEAVECLDEIIQRLDTVEDDRRILSRKKVEGNKQLARIFERVVGTIADRTYHRQCTYQEYHDLKARVAELEADYNRLVSLLEKRFPANPDGSQPDLDVAAVLTENEVLKAEVASKDAALAAALAAIEYAEKYYCPSESAIAEVEAFINGYSGSPVAREAMGEK